jgi:hypothetical protein
MKAAYEELTADLKAMLARMTANQAELLDYPDNSEADVITSEESSEELEATNMKATPEETEAAVKRQDLFKEETYAENIGSLEDRSGYKCLAVRHGRGAKKRSQDSAESRQKSSAARKRAIRHAVPAVRKGNIQKGPGKDSAASGASGGDT